MGNADSFLEKHIVDIDSIIRLLNGRSMNLQSNIDVIRQQLGVQDEYQLLQYYSNNFQKILGTVLDSDLP